MYYTNELTITLKNKKTATKAMEIVKKRLEIGFEYDKNYRKNPSIKMANELELEGNKIVLPIESGYYMPEDANSVFEEIIKDLAKNLEESFECYIFNSYDYSESEIEAEYKNETLIIRTMYNPFCEKVVTTTIKEFSFDEEE